MKKLIHWHTTTRIHLSIRKRKMGQDWPVMKLLRCQIHVRQAETFLRIMYFIWQNIFVVFHSDIWYVAGGECRQKTNVASHSRCHQWAIPQSSWSVLDWPCDGHSLRWHSHRLLIGRFQCGSRLFAVRHGWNEGCSSNRREIVCFFIVRWCEFSHDTQQQECVMV